MQDENQKNIVTSSSLNLDELVFRIVNNDIEFIKLEGADASGRIFQDQLINILNHAFQDVTNTELSSVISNVIQMIDYIKELNIDQRQSTMALLCLFFVLKNNMLTKECFEVYFSAYIPSAILDGESLILIKHKEAIEKIHGLLQTVFNASNLEKTVIESAASILLEDLLSSYEKSLPPTSITSASINAFLADLPNLLNTKNTYENLRLRILGKELDFIVHDTRYNFRSFILTFLSSVLNLYTDNHLLSSEEYYYYYALSYIAKYFISYLNEHPDFESNTIDIYLCIYFHVFDKLQMLNHATINTFLMMFKSGILNECKKEFLETFEYILEKIKNIANFIADTVKYAKGGDIDIQTFSEEIENIITAINLNVTVNTQKLLAY